MDRDDAPAPVGSAAPCDGVKDWDRG